MKQRKCCPKDPNACTVFELNLHLYAIPEAKDISHTPNTMHQVTIYHVVVNAPTQNNYLPNGRSIPKLLLYNSL